MLLVFLFCVTTFLTNSKAQFFYPEKKLSSRYSFTVFQDRQVTYSTNLVETHSDYKDCITVCYNIFDRCKSIDIQIVSNTTLICQFFNDDSPPTQLANGNLFVSTKPPKCSLSCSLTLNPCGKCKCYPSCSAKNRRQHICNCTTVTGIAKSCQEHYNNGVTQTGVFKINANDFPIETMCEMDKVESKNPKINTQKCMPQPSSIMQFSFALSVSYCAITCAKKKYSAVIFDIPCLCASFIDVDDWCHWKTCTKLDYCKIGESSTDCSVTKLSSSNYLIYEYGELVYFDQKSCVNFCTNYQNINSTYNGYVASGIAVTNNDCLCLYGFTGKTTSAYYGCLYYDMAPTIVTNFKEVNEQVIQKSNLITTLSYLDKTFSISFMLKPMSNRGLMCNIIHLTINSNGNYYGDRIPGVWFDPNSRLYISFAVNGDIDYAFITQPLSLNAWSSLLISQTELDGIYTYTVYLNDQIIRNDINYQPRIFKDVKVYASDPWSDVFDGYIKNLKIVNGFVGVWIPMMTRFASWESTFWDKSFEAYENGFGLVNQQWIGLKNLNQITSTFFTDMRIDYAFKEGITFSTRYYNVTIGSSEEKYIFRYEKYNPRGSGEPDRLNANGFVFNNCSNWWTADIQNNGNCNKNMFPTSASYISFGSAKELLSIQFFLRTNLEKDFPTNAP
ncbi:uncharacterized protein LOC105843460 isoform X3 [Hydra vulgaris]|uniref:uncharacterized protein LOC105843460 isoform X3 n=1 Tax=Hydra vulgaris TaxID=6087 RepID=UPI0032EA7A26